MSTVIFHWATPKGLDTPHGRKKLLSRWNLTCKAFGIHRIYCVTDEPIVMNDAEVSFHRFPSLSAALMMADGEVVYVEQGGDSLEGFDHPENAVYVFGSDYGELEEATVSINSELPVHAEIAAGIVLAHGYSQWH